MAQHRGRRGLRRPVDAVDAVVAAYARSDLFAKRRSLMEQWEAWCVGYLAPATDQERLLNGGWCPSDIDVAEGAEGTT